MYKTFITIFVVVIIAFNVSSFISRNYFSANTNPVACTMEAKLCPDGSSVGRTGSKCEFSACPSATIYTNTKYGFNVSLPASWSGYTIVNSVREVRNVSTGAVVSTAPTVSIRHPLWTVQVPRQDIPIDVYTLEQWAGIVSDKYSVSAAPFPPRELARNSKYVFAVPARYNFATPLGWEEVGQIFVGKPLKAFEPVTVGVVQSGITGTVTLGPTCPVERIPPDPNCAPKFYSTSINILKTGSSSVVKIIQSDSKGAFSTNLDLGSYTLQAHGGNVLPRCGEVSVEVKSNQYTTINISCDTGIR